MAFTNNGTLTPYGAPVKLHKIIANSITVTFMDSVKMASGFIAAGTTGALVFGHVQGLVTLKGMPLSTTGVAGADIGSFTNAFATSSTNQTVAKVRAECDCSKFTLYSASLDAAIGTTTGSNLDGGYNCDIASAVTLSESSTTAATTAATTVGQYALLGVDPADSTRAIVNIFESQLFGI